MILIAREALEPLSRRCLETYQELWSAWGVDLETFCIGWYSALGYGRCVVEELSGKTVFINENEGLLPAEDLNEEKTRANKKTARLHSAG
jgi:hypothetical protein